MKVLHLSPGRYSGGIETVLMTLAREREACPEMTPAFAVCFDQGRLAKELSAMGYPVFSMGPVKTRFPWQILRARARLRRRLAAEKFDVAVTHSSWTHALVGGVVRAAGVPLVFWMHNRSTVAGQNLGERRAGRLTPDLVICNSQFTADSMPVLFGERALPHQVIACPVAPPPADRRDPADRATVRRELATSETDKVIIQVGWMEPGKGQALHLEALGRLRDVPGWVCWMVGGAETKPQARHLAALKSLALERGIQDRVHFLGPRQDVNRLLAAADVFCQPNTDPEAFGIVFVEALYAGLPVVSARHGGVLEIVDETCGRLFPPGNAEALAETLSSLCNDQTLRARLTAAAPARARQVSDPRTILPAIHQALAPLTV